MGDNAGGYRGGRGGYRGRGGYEGGERRPYHDYDDPSKYQQLQQNPDRQIVSYDDLF